MITKNISLSKFPTYNTILNRILSSSLFGGNSLSVNLLLILTALTFVIVPIDLEKEISSERDEIEYVMAIFTNSEKEASLEESIQFIYNLHKISVFPSLDDKKPVDDVPDIRKGRAPPLSSI